MSDYGILAKNLILFWAAPFEPDDTPKRRIRRAHDRLQGDEMESGWSKCWNAYYGKAKKPTYDALLAQQERVRKIQQVDARMRAQFISTMELMREADAEFFRHQIEAYRSMVSSGSGEGSEGS